MRAKMGKKRRGGTTPVVLVSAALLLCVVLYRTLHGRLPSEPRPVSLDGTTQGANQHLANPERVATKKQQVRHVGPPADPLDPILAEAVGALTSRVCGSPAVDGYAHVIPQCLLDSPTSKWWRKFIKSGGKQRDLTVHIDEAADYDGLAVGWGIGNKKESAQECAKACQNHMPGKHVGGPFAELPCNAFAWCEEESCFEPDAHTHTKGDCWLKFTEAPANPEVNMRGNLPEYYRTRHPTAPQRVQWVSGVLLPKNVPLRNGTWGPRWNW